MSELAKWYVVHTYSGYENKVAATIEKAVENRKLQDFILTIKVPTEMETELDDNNNKKEVERKVFPGYVLIKMVMTDESWHIVRNTRGCTGFVGPGSKPVPLTDAEVQALGVENDGNVLTLNKEDRASVEIPFVMGESVKIIAGPLNGFIGVVEACEPENNMVRVVVSMFGRETPAELTIDQVSAIS